MTHCTQLPQQKKLSQQHAVHDQQSVTHCCADVSLSISMSKLVNSSLVFVDNKLTLICLLK